MSQSLIKGFTVTRETRMLYPTARAHTRGIVSLCQPATSTLNLLYNTWRLAARFLRMACGPMTV